MREDNLMYFRTPITREEFIEASDLSLREAIEQWENLQTIRMAFTFRLLIEEEMAETLSNSLVSSPKRQMFARC